MSSSQQQPPKLLPTTHEEEPSSSYYEMSSSKATTGSTSDLPRSTISNSSANSYAQQQQQQLTPQEVAILRQLLADHRNLGGGMGTGGDMSGTIPVLDRREALREIRSATTADSSVNSEYPEFAKSTHAWAVFADDPQKRATKMDRFIGVLIIAFQLFTYWIFAREAVDDYHDSQVAVKTSHVSCINSNQQPSQDTAAFTCEANFTNNFDAFIAFFMLGVFLTGDFLKAFRVLRAAPPFGITTVLFASLTAIEIVAAYISACLSVSYNLYIGEVTDAVEVGVGLLFIRELSQRAYTGIRYGKAKQYKSFFGVLSTLIAIGMMMDPLCEYLFVTTAQYR